MIFIDSSEARRTTRLPHAIIKQSKQIDDLESKTGADLLVSVLRLPASNDELLKRHCESGALVQRKSGNDLTASITDGRLSQSLCKMRDWCNNCWLVYTGQVQNIDGQVMIDGRASISYNAFNGALKWYQWRGGYVQHLDSDHDLIAWLVQLEDSLRELQEQPEKRLSMGVPLQAVVFDNAHTTTLTTLPQIGVDKASTLLKEHDTLAKALCVLTDLKAPMPRGIGISTQRLAREWLQLGDWQKLDIVEINTWHRVVSSILSLPEEKWDSDWALLYAAACKMAKIPCSEFGTWEEWLESFVKGKELEK